MAKATQYVLFIYFGEIKITANGENDPLWEVEIKGLSSRGQWNCDSVRRQAEGQGQRAMV